MVPINRRILGLNRINCAPAVESNIAMGARGTVPPRKIKITIKITNATHTRNSTLVPIRCPWLVRGLTIALCTAWLAMVSAWAQVGVTKGYKAPLYDPQTRRLLLIKTTVTQLNDKGEVALIIEAPESFFNLDDSTITSPGDLSVRSGNELFTITGTGFLWGQSKTNSVLVISNNVHTIIRRTSNEPKGRPARVLPGAAQNLDVTARHFEYDFKSG